MLALLARLATDALAMPTYFLDVATTDPISAVLVAIGGLLTTLAIGAFGALTLGAGIDLLRGPTIGRRHPRAD